MSAFGRRVGLTSVGRRVLLAGVLYILAAVMLSWSRSKPVTAASMPDRPATTAVSKAPSTAPSKPSTMPTTQIIQARQGSQVRP